MIKSGFTSQICGPFIQHMLLPSLQGKNECQIWSEPLLPHAQFSWRVANRYVDFCWTGAVCDIWSILIATNGVSTTVSLLLLSPLVRFIATPMTWKMKDLPDPVGEWTTSPYCYTRKLARSAACCLSYPAEQVGGKVREGCHCIGPQRQCSTYLEPSRMLYVRNLIRSATCISQVRCLSDLI